MQLEVYNFQVEELHCYAVGEGQVLVHNNSLENAPGRTGQVIGEVTDAEVEAAIRSVPTHHAPTPQNVDISKLIPPSSRPVADPAKLARHGPFDWNKYTPIIVETDGTHFWIMDGMTRVENARRSAITTLPAYVYTRR